MVAPNGHAQRGVTWAQLDQHKKPVLIVNLNGFWDPLIALFRRMQQEGFLHKAFLGSHVDLPVAFVDSVEQVIPALREALAETPRPELETPDGARLM